MTQIILYMMITRINPFENESYEQLIKNNLKGEVNFDTFNRATTTVGKDCRLHFTSTRFSQTDANSGPQSPAFSVDAASEVLGDV